ncbi:MAG TPA: ROK family protein [Anaerolineae bacterium]|nr:ROK family protein [Anaerolineae bacterium]HIP71447.1 ROK family protein [Anaerolineae bacterium]
MMMTAARQRPMAVPPLKTATVTVGLDVGGTKTEVLLVDEDRRPLAQTQCPTDTTSPEGVMSSIVTVVNTALEQAGIAPSRIGAIGIGVPGLVRPQDGTVQLAANLNLREYALAEAVTAVFPAPVILENDARLATIGAYQYLRARQPIQHMAYLSIGTGIAAGVVLDGRLWRGTHGMAGEIGHIVVEPDGAMCACGQRGCLETIASGPAVAGMAARLMRPNPVNNLTADAVYQATESGDSVAQTIIQRVSYYLSHTIQWLIMSYDVEKVVLGGGVAQSGPAFLDPILLELSRMRAESHLAETMLGADKIMLLPQGFNAGVWGAITLAQKGD